MSKDNALRRRFGHMAPAYLKPVRGFEFKFYTKDRGEPPHVHVFRAGLPKLKFWLETPIRLAGDEPRRWKVQEVRRAREIIEERRKEFIKKWKAFFGEP